MKNFIREISPYLLTKLMSEGGDYGEIFYEKHFSTFLNFEDNRIQKGSEGFDKGVGIRLIKNGKTYYGYTSDLSKNSLEEVVRSLVKIDGEGKTKVGLRYMTGYTKVILDPEDYFPERKKEILLKANDIVRSYDSRIKQAGITLKDSKREILIINTEGEIVEDTQIRVALYVEAIAEENGYMYRGYESAGGLSGYEFFERDDIDIIDYISSKAAHRAVLGLNAKHPPAGSMPVVISSEAGGTMIHEAVGHGLEADLAEKGLSVYAGKIGEKVASELITVIDDGTIPAKMGSYNFDDEGVPAQKTVLIENGYLKSFLYDRLTAMQTGKSSTGNGRRDTYRNIPIVRMRNTYIAPGKDNPHDFIKDIKKGLYVVKMGGGQVNTVNGDFMFEVIEGYMIEKGEITYPVKGASLLGNGPQAMRDVEAVGYDLGWAIGTCGKSGQAAPVGDGQPTIKIKSLVVGGTV
ncbi:TldD protein [Persephonella hydrogeniphila]|uniref:TldD protein n=1 Tax=Persephonella hydrogeniphila TaxID=198703 RepID=A0A285N078_9AQUI|nr:TldD/PmbA family protein [Persephonella hydrogeniphila]SNZ02849.1 TldD protein [Persephonella hydrogeniphila]